MHTAVNIVVACTLFMLTNLIQQVHGLLHLLGFDHEISEEAEEDMEKEEEHILNTLEWKGKGLIKSAYDNATNMEHLQNSVGLSYLCPFNHLLFLERKMSVKQFLITLLPMDFDLLCTEANNNIKKGSLREEHQTKLSHIICDIDGELT